MLVSEPGADLVGRPFDEVPPVTQPAAILVPVSRFIIPAPVISIAAILPTIAFPAIISQSPQSDMTCPFLVVAGVPPPLPVGGAVAVISGSLPLSGRIVGGITVFPLLTISRFPGAPLRLHIAASGTLSGAAVGMFTQFPVPVPVASIVGTSKLIIPFVFHSDQPPVIKIDPSSIMISGSQYRETCKNCADQSSSSNPRSK
jgi:hypothetical protein